ncbi:hypothetical protein ACFWP5_08970 [Streptomyces sp. NPDC058469]|uniref:hypothetical protein n=1 Tax=Streptomyces sp. NPDC058469 TaxID=3346514 RepID=UPI00364BC9B8
MTDDSSLQAALTVYAMTFAEAFDKFAVDDIRPALQKMMDNHCRDAAKNLRAALEEQIDFQDDPIFNDPSFTEERRSQAAMKVIDGKVEREQEKLNLLVRQLLLWDQDLGVHTLMQIGEVIRSRFPEDATEEQKWDVIKGTLGV